MAHQLGHDRVYGIDSRLPLDFEGVGQAAAAESRFGQLLGQMNAVGNEAIETLAEWLAESTVGGMLARMNSPEMIVRSHVPYIEFFVPVVTNDGYAGANMVGDWYTRNLRIFANLTRIPDPASERIVVIFGAGHIALLRQFVIDHPAYCAEDPLEYLNGL